MTKSKKAILWGQDNLLAQAMEIFLGGEEAWDVVRISAEDGISLLVEEVRRIKPDLLVLCSEKFEAHADPLVKLILDRPELSVLADQPKLRVITISLENNVMQVYSKQSITVRNVSDLMGAIEMESFSGNPIQKEVENSN